MPEQPDYTEAGKVFENSMKEALAHLDKLNEELIQAKEKAIDQEFAAKDELHRIQNEAEKLSQEFINQHRKEYDSRVRNDVMMEVIEKLMQSGVSSADIKRWLEVSDEMIAHTFTYLKFERLGDRMANVYYDTQGRAGDIYFDWDGLVVKFPFEFEGGNSLVAIDVPDVEHWVAKTGFSLDQRMLILDFVALRVIRDQAPEHLYEITADQIKIIRGEIKK